MKAHRNGMASKPFFLLLLLGVFLVFQSAGSASDIKSDERVIFFPTEARLSDDGDTWVIPIHGWVYEPENGDVLRGLSLHEFRKALNLEKNQAATVTFEKRARLFLVDNERGKHIEIRLGKKSYTLEESDRDGHFRGTIKLKDEIVQGLSSKGRLPFYAITRNGDRDRYKGVVHLIKPMGVSVISDIDDTIKVSQVTDKQQLIINTFFLPFRPVEGMAAKYRQWADSGVQFHYISSSPWQLYKPLSKFMSDSGFPDATLHLKGFRFKDSTFLKLFEDPLQGKLAMIEPLLRDYPKRRFILVGDSGERDPEVYASVARKYPEQILRVYIRNVSGESADSPRYKKAFKGLPDDKWMAFDDPQVISLP